MTDTGEMILSNISYRWRWLFRAHGGILYASDELPIYDEDLGDWRILRGNLLSLAHLDNGHFNDISEPINITQYTCKTFFTK